MRKCGVLGVRFVGPLEAFAPNLAEELGSLGFAPTSAAEQLRLMAHLSRWMAARGLEPGELSDSVLDEFLVERRREYANLGSRRALGPTLRVLRGLGAIPAAVPETLDGPVDRLLERFRRYLLAERAVSAPVAAAYLRYVRPFVASMGKADLALGLGGIDGEAVGRFLVRHLPGLGRKSAQMTATAMRSFLRFLHAEGIIAVDLVPSVPSFAFWQAAGVPRALSVAQTQALEGALDPSTWVGRRDVAAVGLMLRLGLRCGEVAAMQLEDLDWAGGTLRVRGKGGRVDALPLPEDVGRALAEYLRGRPTATGTRAVFVRAHAPFTALRPNSVSCIVGRAADRAGIGTVHAHRLRHTAASRALNAGASMEEVAQLLRHASPATILTYAKVDLVRLRALARPWPGNGSLV